MAVPDNTLPSSTRVYLIRHGIAMERGTYPDDGQRPLTPKGIAKTKAIAQRLAILGLEFHTLLTSPLVRAVQTAEILCQAGLAVRYEPLDALAPDGCLETWLQWLGQWQAEQEPILVNQCLALVGHEPDLSRWAQHLVHGQESGQWILKKAGIIGLELPVAQQAMGHSQLFWLAPPRLIL